MPDAAEPISVARKAPRMAIRCYSTKGAYGAFSNFAAFPFALQGCTWPTSEHYFQAQKFFDQAYGEPIRLVASPMIAARMGRSRAVPIREDWEAVQDEVMRTALRAKFASHAQLQQLLLGSGTEELVEATTTDLYWGC